MVIPLDISFKGSRTYLHSTDIFNAMVAKTGAVRDLNLKFTKMLTTSLEAVPVGEVEKPSAAPARFRGKDGHGAEVDFVIREAAAPSPIGRYPYDEEGVVSGARVDATTITDDNADAATPIERIVAMNKRLINDALSPGKRLLFTSVALRHIPVSPLLRLDLRAHVNNRIFRSAVFGDGQELGEIVFYGA